MNDTVKILIIRFSSIGDIVLTSPVVRCLHNQLEGEVEIHYLTKNSFRSLMEESPYVKKVWGIDKSTNEIIEALQKEEYDYVVDLHKNMRASRVKKKLDALSFSFDKLNIKKWLLVNFKWNLMPDLHIVDRYLESVKALGIENDGEGLDYFLPANFQPDFTVPSEFKSYTALVLGAAHFTKRIPEEKLLEIIKQSIKPIVLIGGKEDAELGNRLEKSTSDKVLSAAGKTNLHGSAYLISKSEKVITSDTGMMHIAAAFKKPIVSLWGNTVPEFGMYPHYPKGQEKLSTILEAKELGCRPCSKIGFQKCPKGHFKCMNELDVSNIK